MAIRLMLDNIRSRYNVGAIFRTADAVGVEQVYLCGRTPTPIDRFGRPDEQIRKTSLGANETVSWTHIGEAEDWSTAACVACVKELQDAGYMVVAVEQTEQSQDISTITWPERVVCILGAEDVGVQASLIEQADQCVELPMLGTKESLNVSVTAGVVLYHALFSQRSE